MLLLDPNGSAPAGGGSAVATPAAPAPVSAPVTIPAPGADRAPSIPPGHRLIPDDQYEKYTKTYETASKFGDLGQYVPLIETLNGRGLKPETLAQLLSGKPAEAKKETAPLDVESLRSQWMKDLNRQTAAAAHTAKMEKLPTAIKERVKQYLGGEDEVLSPLLEKVFLSEVQNARFAKPRDQNDPLFGEYGRDWDDDLLNEALKSYADIGAKLKGRNLASIGQAVNAAKAAAAASTPAGNNSGNGSPNGNSGRAKMWHEMSDEEKLARVQQNSGT